MFLRLPFQSWRQMEEKKGETTEERSGNYCSTAQQILSSSFKTGSFLCMSNERMLANFKIRAPVGSFLSFLLLASVSCVIVTLLYLKLQGY